MRVIDKTQKDLDALIKHLKSAVLSCGKDTEMAKYLKVSDKQLTTTSAYSAANNYLIMLLGLDLVEDYRDLLAHKTPSESFVEVEVQLKMKSRWHNIRFNY